MRGSGGRRMCKYKIKKDPAFGLFHMYAVLLSVFFGVAVEASLACIGCRADIHGAVIPSQHIRVRGGVGQVA
jgi:hypothetical protein